MRRAAHITALTASIALAAVLAGPLAAGADTWTDGTTQHPFVFTELAGTRLAGGASGVVTPRTTILWQYSPDPDVDPRSVQALPNGNVLIASRDLNRVVEVAPDGRVAWEFTDTDYHREFPAAPAAEPFIPFAARRITDIDGSGHTLITMRWGQPVFELDEHEHVVWRFGTGVSGYGAGQLWDGYSAERLPGGDTLIADNQGCRVLRVRSSDYDPTAPAFGYTAASVVWQHGVDGENARDHEFADAYLGWPRTAHPLANGNVLITDQDQERVVEVTPAGAVAWSYGTPDVSGTGPNQLYEPADAIRLPGGDTLIVHGKQSGRVIRVSPAGTIVGTYPDPEDTPEDGGLREARDIDLAADGTLVIADEGHLPRGRAIRVGATDSAKATSDRIDCGLPGVRKTFERIIWAGKTPDGGSVDVFYSVDGAAWKTAAASGALPAGTTGTYVRYRLQLHTQYHQSYPMVDSVSVDYHITGNEEDSDDDTGTPAPETGSPTTTRTAGHNTRRVAAGNAARGLGGPAGGGGAGGGGLGAQAAAGLTQASGMLLAVQDAPVLGMPGGGASMPLSGGPAAGFLALLYAGGFAAAPAGTLITQLLAVLARR